MYWVWNSGEIRFKPINQAAQRVTLPLGYKDELWLGIDSVMKLHCWHMKLRAITPVHVKYSFHISIKTYLLYFPQLLFQNTHISLPTLQETSIKYSFFIHFLLFYLMIILFEFKLIFQATTKTDGPGSEAIGLVE